MMDFRALSIGIFGASIIFIIKERKLLKTLFSAYLNKDLNNELIESLEEMQKSKGLSINEAKDRLFTKEIIKAMDIDSTQWEVNRFLTLHQGDRVSFEDEKAGFIQGDFLGIVKSKLVGYDDLYVVRNNKTSTIRKASISYIKEETINVYR